MLPKSFKIYRRSYETWKQCIIRFAKPFGLQDDVLNSFHTYTNSGMKQELAAYHACYDWNVVPTKSYRQILKNKLREVIKAVL